MFLSFRMLTFPSEIFPSEQHVNWFIVCIFFSYLAFNLTSFFVLSTIKIYHSFDHKNMIYIYPHWIESTQKSNPIDDSALTLDLQT